MSTSYNFHTNSHFKETDFILNAWSDQLIQGIKFVLHDDTDFVVRQMSKTDIEFVVQLEQGIFPDPWPRVAFQTELQDIKHCLCMVGIIDNIIVAYAISQFIFNELHIHNLAVDMHYRRRGCAKTLLWLISEIAFYCHIKICHLEVRRSNVAALSLYKKFGFEITGIRTQYYVKEHEDALLMSKSFLN